MRGFLLEPSSMLESASMNLFCSPRPKLGIVRGFPSKQEKELRACVDVKTHQQCSPVHWKQTYTLLWPFVCCSYLALSTKVSNLSRFLESRWYTIFMIRPVTRMLQGFLRVMIQFEGPLPSSILMHTKPDSRSNCNKLSDSWHKSWLWWLLVWHLVQSVLTLMVNVEW